MFYFLVLLYPFAQASSQKSEGSSCSQFKRIGYHCVPTHLCRNNTIETDGSGILTIRVLNELSRDEMALESSCPNRSEKCCKLLTSSGQEEIQPGSPPGQAGQCGVRNTAGLGGREVKENIAKLGEWPHVCLIIEDAPQDIPSYIGAASLIRINVVLTGAAKVYEYIKRPETIAVRCGEWDFKGIVTREYQYQEIRVERIVVHPDFNNESLENNFAILFLKEEFKLTELVNPICLPRPGQTLSLDSECFASGWGKESFQGDFPTALKSLELPLVEPSTCQQLLRSTRLSQFFLLHKSFVCAGGEAGRDTCTLDGGGPLVCRHPAYLGKYVQVGIVSWGIACGTGDVPGVYSSVPYAMCWIDEVVRCFLNSEQSLFGLEASDCPRASTSLSCDRI